MSAGRRAFQARQPIPAPRVRIDEVHPVSRDSAPPRAAAPDAGPQPYAPLSAQTKTAISIVLFLQIVAVLIVVFARSGNGLAASPLQLRLRESVPFVRQYAQLTHGDLGYNYHFTQGGPEDDDCVIDVELKLPDGSTRKETIPPRGMTPPLRYQRHKMLAYSAGMAAGDPERESRLPQAIAQRLIDETGAVGGRIQVRRHSAQSAEDAGSTDPKRRDPNSENYWSTLYDAQILVDEGKAQLLKKASALEAAPAARGAAVPAAPNATTEEPQS